MRIDVLHGPNLNLLGTREPEIYGADTLEDVEARIARRARELGDEVSFFQTNSEGALIDRIHARRREVDGFVVNAGGLTHTSVALRDALVGVGHPFVEVHLSNTAAREGFRQRSYLSDVAVGVVFGFGADSYLLGFEGLRAHIAKT